MGRNIICYDAGFQHLGYMAAQLPDAPGGKPVPVTLGVSDAVLPPKQLRRGKTVTLMSVERILKQVDFVRKLHYAYNPVAYFVELPTGGAKNAVAIKGMAFATAYLVTTLHLVSEPNVLKRFFLPSTVKKCLCGRNDASKLDIARAVIAFWPEIDDWPGFKVITKKKTKKGKKVVEEDKAAAHDATDAGAVCITATCTDDYLKLWEHDDDGAGFDPDF